MVIRKKTKLHLELYKIRGHAFDYTHPHSKWLLLFIQCPSISVLGIFHFKTQGGEVITNFVA